ncbi:GLPGLI family protein [Winogradskyella pacifica]|uniref:GLPGLI family protein n=1 Tax=Winogradskyella pacifica TaxID=664642 RepID=A0A3D9LMH7_9FLAO|nr:GLPGLI family protein [Winogradskyella pacifica]REE08402.1 GLPGLI family protein [Winogradskyella pacifica]
MRNTILIVVLLGSYGLSAQLKGKITYRLEIIKDSIEQPFENKENTDAQNEVFALMHESQPVEGYLIFNDSIAIYNVEPKIDIPGWNNGSDGLIITPSNVNLSWMMAGGSTTYYNDWSRDYSITQNAIMGPAKRVIQKPKEWTITEESKVIDGYTCYAATIDKRSDKKVKAWFTPEIPVKHGPRGFNGLPGLIMEIEDVINLWTIVEMDFDNPEAEDIIEPIEGELITQEEYVTFSGNPFGDN